MTLSLEIAHLSKFHKFDKGHQFIFHLDGVQSARVIRYAIWPGGCSIPDGLSIEDQGKIVADYQAKWREESGLWNEFESGITREKEQVFDISDAALATSQSGPIALKLCGQLNHATYHELFLRFESWTITGNDGRNFKVEEFEKMGQAYWQAFSDRGRSTPVE